MKKIIFVSILLILTGVYAHTWTPAMQAVTSYTVAGAPVACSVSNDSVQQECSSSSCYPGHASFGGNAWKAQSFTLAVNTKLTQIDMYLKDTEATAGTITISIYDNTGDPNPGSEVADTTVAVNSADTAEGPGWVAFVLATPKSLTAGEYHIVLRSTGQTTLPHNYYSTGSTAYTGGYYSYSADGGSTWSQSSIDMAFKLYGCEE